MRFMKIYNYISMLFLAGAAIVASCSQNEELTGETPDSLQGFQISVSDEGFMDESGKTRATENGYTTRFSNGDAIGIFAVRGETVVEDIKNRKFTLTDGYWELTDGGDPIEYKGSQFQRMTFYAYYPYNANVTFDPTKVDPFETYVNNWKIGSEQNEGNYTQYDLMTSTGSVQGDRLKGQIAFTMQHRMALAVVKMPNLTYSFTNGGIDDYLLPLTAGSFTVNNTQATPYYQESTDTYRFLVNPKKEFSIKGTYSGVSEMEYEAKGTLEGGTAKMYTIEDKSKINHTLQVGDYFCADGKIVSVDAETVPENVIGIVCYVGNSQPSVTHTELYSAEVDALRRDFPACTHGIVLSIKNSVVKDSEQNDVALKMFHSSKSGYYSDWFTSDENWANKFVAHEDASFTTTWSIDLHFHDSVNSVRFPGNEFKSATVHRWIHPYAVPYRCLYSRNVDNLFMAGRNMSCTHVALGTVRVMRTTGMMGEVVGMAAGLCHKHRVEPRDIYHHHLPELKQLMQAGLGKRDVPDNQRFNEPNKLLEVPGAYIKP